MSNRAVSADPRESWYIFLPEKLTPKQVLQILRSSLAGDIWQLWSLTSLMLNSWPMLKKCQHELRSAVMRTNFVVRPYCEEGQEPTETAKAKADLIQKSMKVMKPDPTSDEKGFQGMVYDIMDAFLIGLSAQELVWGEPERTPAGWQRLPRAAAWVHPRHLTFGNDGKIVIVSGNKRDYARIDPDKFIVSQFSSQSGSCLGCGMIRSLAWWWSALVFNREWMLNFAQRFGTPFRSATYKPMSEQALNKLEAAMDESGNSGWLLAPEGTIVEVQPPHPLGKQNPHVSIKDMADNEAQMLILGQSATTSPTPGKLGNDEAHIEVRRERIEEMAHWVATVLNEQFVQAILRVNYGGEVTECPIIEPDFTETESPLEAAQRMQIVMGMGLPVMAEEAYLALSLQQPEPGDLVIERGRIGVMADQADPIQPSFEEQVDQQIALSEASGQFDDQSFAARSPVWDGDQYINAVEQVGHPFHGNQWTSVALDAPNDPSGSPNGKILRAVLVVGGKRYRGSAHLIALANLLKQSPHADLRWALEGFETESGHFLSREQAATYTGKKGKLSSQTMMARSSQKLNVIFADQNDRNVSVKGLVTDDKGRILLIRDKNTGYWDLPGGHLHRGEQNEAGLEREVKEETGLNVSVDSPLGKRRLNLGGQRMVHFYNCSVDGELPDVTMSDEHIDWRWFTKADALAVDSGAFKSLLSKWLSGSVNAADSSKKKPTPDDSNMETTTIIGLAAALEIELEPILKELERIARQETKGTDDVWKHNLSSFDDALPSLLEEANQNHYAKHILESGLATAFLAGVVSVTGKYGAVGHAILQPGKVFRDIENGHLLENSINTPETTHAAIQKRAESVSKVIKAELVQDLRERLKGAGRVDAINIADVLGNLEGHSLVAKHVKINLDSAKGYGQFSAQQTSEWLAAHSYQELYREENRHEWRDWPTRWKEQGGQFYGSPSDYPEGRMLALVSSHIWEDLSNPNNYSDGTGDPYAPLAFNSGMALRPVSAEDAKALGLVHVKQEPIKREFNKSLSFSAELDQDISAALKKGMTDFEEETA